MQNFESLELTNRVSTALSALENSKAVSANVINFENKGMMTEALIVVSGTSNVHMQAIANKLAEQLKENKIEYTVEGLNSDVWVLVDCGDVVVHIFSEESREFYALEKLWNNMEQPA